MPPWERHISVVDGARIISVLGGIFVVFGGGQVIRILAAGGPITSALIEFLLIGIPGLGLLYGWYWLLESNLHPDVRPRVALWCLRGAGVMFGVVVLLVLNPEGTVSRPFRAIVIATALGSLGGLGIGINEARALSRARELQETVEQLEMANERLEQFAYAASHDLQEPLRMISSYLLLLENRYADDLDEEAQEFIEFAVGGADRMRSMVDNLLKYSRVTRGDQLEPTDANAVLDAVFDDLQLRIEETDATITTDELPTVTADRNQLAQVFQNLISNALTYSGAEPPKVHVGVECVHDAWQFSVADEGIGIDPEYHNRIFNVFERVHLDEETSEFGTGGVGLALCERIIERHGGEIWVESESGKGATFYFTIPETEEHEEQQTASTERSSPQG